MPSPSALGVDDSEIVRDRHFFEIDEASGTAESDRIGVHEPLRPLGGSGSPRLRALGKEIAQNFTSRLALAQKPAIHVADGM
jgi:hypothetical protein